MPHPIYPSNEIASRGKALYEQQIRARVEPDNKGKYLVVDIETGEFEMGDDQMVISDRALAKHPEAALFLLRVGYPAAARIGAGLASREVKA